MLVAVSLSGCFVQETPDATSSPVPSQTPVFATEEEALAAATEAYEKYLKVVDSIFADGGADPERLLDVATLGQYEKELSGYRELASKRLYGVGKSRIESPMMQYFDSSTSNVVIYVCLDISATDIRDANGVSTVKPNRVDRYTSEVSLESDGSSLLVASDVPWGGESVC